MKTEDLLEYAPYTDDPAAGEAFDAALREELLFHYGHNEMYHRFCERKGFDPRAPFAVGDVPPVSVAVFKALGAKLNSVPEEEVSLSLQSSATSGTPSTVTIDRVTSRRQAKAMIRVVESYIGKERRPFLVMDIDPRSGDRRLLGARFAAVTGYLRFASRAGYFLKADAEGTSYFDVAGMREYVATLDAGVPAVVFGFTYILYQHVLRAIGNSGTGIMLPKGSKLIHIGGWKKLEAEKIGREQFNARLSACFGIEPCDVIDIYGFTEQMGLNYPDCRCGWKHTPAYSRVIVRDPVTHGALPPGREGLLEFVTPVPHSYPGNAVLTDDIGVVAEGVCPEGRGGTRFKVVGRMKKAEARGCGDILSQKLTFRHTEEGPAAVSSGLEVRFGKAPPARGEPASQLRALAASVREGQAWLCAQPAEDIAGLISQVAGSWLGTPALSGLKDKGLLFLSSWCAKEHLLSVARRGMHGSLSYLDGFCPFPDSDRHYLRAVPRGLVCHWLAGNVQVLGMFALVQSLVAKNANLLKVSSRDDGVFSSLLSTFRGAEYHAADGRVLSGNDLLESIAIVYFDHGSRVLGEEMSRLADVRIAWGGRTAVEAVAGYPARYDAETVVFGPKLSFSVINREALEDEREARKLARRLSVDVSVFDQTGCASPHNVYIEKGGAVSPEDFVSLLAAAMERTEAQIPVSAASAEQVAQVHSMRGVYDFKGRVVGSPSLSWTILVDDDGGLCGPVYSRTVFVHVVDSVFESLSAITGDVQSVGVPAVDRRILEYAEQAAARGVARLPLIGRMLNFEMPWDGVFLFDRLVRWHTVGGPLV